MNQLKDKHGNTPLILSAKEGNLNFVKGLLARGANMCHQNNEGKTALQLAKGKDKEAIIELLEKIAACFQLAKNELITISSLDFEEISCINATNSEGNTILMLSAQCGKSEVVEYLVQQGANIHHQNNAGYTALELAQANQHIDVIDHLLLPAFFEAAENGHLDCLKELVKLKADIDATDENEDTALILSAFYGHLDCVKYLVQQGTDITWKGDEKKTALKWAKEAEQTDVEEFLSAVHSFFKKPTEELLKKLFGEKYNLDVRQLKDKHGNTPLILSAKEGNLNFVKELLARGANIDAQNNEGKTALELTNGEDKEEIVKLLKKVDNCFQLAQNKQITISSLDFEEISCINAPNNEGNKILMLGAEGGKPEVVKYLVQQGANIHHQNNEGYTALELVQTAQIANRLAQKPLLKATENGRENLLARGANIDAQNNEGKTVLQLTNGEDKEEIVKLLKKTDNCFQLAQDKVMAFLQGKTTNPWVNKLVVISIIGVGILLGIWYFQDEVDVPSVKNTKKVVVENREENKIEDTDLAKESTTSNPASSNFAPWGFQKWLLLLLLLAFVFGGGYWYFRIRKES